MRPVPSIGTDTEVAVKFPKHFVTKHEAIRILDRTDHTLYRWTREGLVRKRKRGGVYVWEVSELMRAKAQNIARGRAGKFKPGHVPTSPGRPRHKSRPDIVRMLNEGYDPGKIAEKLGCGNSIVSKVRAEIWRKQGVDFVPGSIKGWVRTDEAMRLVGLRNRKSISRWHHKGYLQRVRVGNYYYFDPNELKRAKGMAQQSLRVHQFRPRAQEE